MSLGLILLGSPVPIANLETETLNWIKNINNQASVTTIRAVNSFILGCKIDNIWSKFRYVNLRCGNTLDAALTALMGVTANNKDIQNPGTGSYAYSEGSGLSYVGGAFISTGLTEASVAPSIGGAYLAAYTGVVSTRGCLIGSEHPTDGSIFDFRLYPSFDGTFYGAAFYAQRLITRTQNKGFLAVGLTGTTGYLQHHSTVSSFAVTPRTATSNPIIIGTQRAEFFTQPTRGEVIGLSLTSIESERLRVRFESFQNSLGRL
jgi:hypothetical protein